MLFPRNQKEAIYNFTPENGWPDQEAKQYDRGVSQSIYQLGAKQLGKAIVNS